MTLSHIKKDKLHQIIDELSDDSLQQLTDYVEYLLFRERYQDKDWFEKVYDLFAPVRSAADDLTAEVIDSAIDEAFREVRGG